MISSGAASGEEARFFHELSRKWTPLSDTIRRVEFRFGEDSDHSPAVWITIVTPSDLNPSKEKIDEIHEAGEKFRTEVLNSDTKRWPYVDIRTE